MMTGMGGTGFRMNPVNLPARQSEPASGRAQADRHLTVTCFRAHLSF